MAQQEYTVGVVVVGVETGGVYHPINVGSDADLRSWSSWSNDDGYTHEAPCHPGARTIAMQRLEARLAQWRRVRSAREGSAGGGGDAARILIAAYERKLVLLDGQLARGALAGARRRQRRKRR
jgi:hypothetical protein